MASNACKEAPRFLLWTADGLYELLEVRFKFSKSANWQNQQWLFQQSNHCANSTPVTGTQAGAQSKDFNAVSETDLARGSSCSAVGYTEIMSEKISR